LRRTIEGKLFLRRGRYAENSRQENRVDLGGGSLSAGQLIVRRGEIIDAKKLAAIAQLRAHLASNESCGGGAVRCWPP